MSTIAKRLPVIVLVGLMLIMIGSGLGGTTRALQSTPDPAEATEIAPTDVPTETAPDSGGALPVERPTIVGSLNGIPVEGIAGSFCWPQPDTAAPQCSFVDDPQPITPINVVNGDAIVFSTEPVSPAPTTFIGILLDDQNADGEPQETNLSNLGGIFTVDNLTPGSHRLQVDALYPGEEQNQPFVSYVYLLSVGEALPTEAPTEAVTEVPTEVVPGAETPTLEGEVTPEATETPADSTSIDVTPTEQANPESATQTQVAVEFEQTNVAATATACANVPELCVPTEAATELPTEVATETPTELPTEAPTATETPIVLEPTAVPPTETPVPTVVVETVVVPTATETPVQFITAAPETSVPTTQLPVVGSGGGGNSINVTIPIPQAKIIVGGRSYEPVAVNACAGNAEAGYVCMTQPLNTSLPRILAAPGDAAQVTFSASRPTAITLSVLSSDGSKVIGTAPIRPDNLILYNLPPVNGNYVVSVEFVYPEGKATYFFRLGIGS